MRLYNAAIQSPSAFAAHLNGNHMMNMTNATCSPDLLRNRAAWIALLTSASLFASLALACATPFPALAALAALHLRRRDAIALVAVGWLVNQAVGYGFLNYPRTWDSFAWGGALLVGGLAALAAAGAVQSLLRRGSGLAMRAVALLAAFAAAFAVYEGVLYAFTALLPIEADAFSMATVLFILKVNALAFVALYALQLAGEKLGVAVRRPASAALQA